MEGIEVNMLNTIRPHLDHALKKVREHPDHWLVPSYRQKLYNILDPNTLIPIQTQVKPWLDLYTARYVLPLWEPITHDPEQLWEGYFQVPSEMISSLEGLLHGTVSKELVSKNADHWGEVSGLTGEIESSEFYHAWCVYDAALSGLLCVLGIDEFRDWHFEDSITEIDDVHSDVANWAAIAYAGGIWHADFPIRKEHLGRVDGHWDRDLEEVRDRRRKFWEWWLLEAIPMACEQAEQNR
jgi:hypothetical protein